METPLHEVFKLFSSSASRLETNDANPRMDRVGFLQLFYDCGQTDQILDANSLNYVFKSVKDDTQ
jgi:hypothetical protein